MTEIWKRPFGLVIFTLLALTFGTPARAQGLCLGSSETPSVASPQVIGTSITITASSTTCGSPTYQFWEQLPTGAWVVAQAWSGSNTFSWNTSGSMPGSYDFEVWARDASSSAQYDSVYDLSYTLNEAAPQCAKAAGATSFPVGTPISITASSQTCGNPQYQFWELGPCGAWNIAQAWSSTSTFLWNTNVAAGNYIFEVWTRDASSTAQYDSYVDLDYTLTPPAATCTAATESPSVSSPQPVGTLITVTATAATCANPLFQFWEHLPNGAWVVAQAWSSNSVYSWDTSGAVPGQYDLEVWVRDATSNATYDAFTDLNYTLQ